MNNQYKVLIINDEKELCNLVGEQISCNFVDYQSVYQGEQALSKLQENTYDIIVTDSKMPGLCGFDFLEKIKQAAKETTDIFVMTGFSDSSAMEKAMDRGASEVFQKPTEIDKLITTIREYAQKQKAAA